MIGPDIQQAQSLELLQRMLDGDERALSKLITLVEYSPTVAAEIADHTSRRAGKSHRVGITGPPGAGKSTLVDALTMLLRSAGHTVAIMAIDPTSPFTGGAVLGDRVRMQQHYLDRGVFIRSIATRGASGGLSRSVRDIANLFDAFQKDFILIETVGVGQNEVDILEEADTTIVVLTPESGDTMQAMKAGLLEIADILVVNKRDRPGAEALMMDLEGMLQMSSRQGEWHGDWEVPVLSTQSDHGVGIAELLESIKQHRLAITESGVLNQIRQQRRQAHFIQLAVEEIRRRLQIGVSEMSGPLGLLFSKVLDGELSPYSAALSLLEDREALAAVLTRR
ncbi:MAG: methylmalonyl Co-A mutase-associated GTPase MeaB [Chloroflexota bacterium]|nr:MAG: methylmalonyl Co-A mutase-associated GTPase MeaB [Chloroflexota bacterium]